MTEKKTVSKVEEEMEFESVDVLEAELDQEDIKLFPLKGYFILNIVFYMFCLIHVFIVHKAGGQTRELIFFFSTIAAGFSIVSVFDFVYDRYALKKISNSE